MLVLAPVLSGSQDNPVKHFGSDTFTAKIALSLSEPGYALIRNREMVSASLSGKVIRPSSRPGFLCNFKEFETALVIDLRRHFPAMSDSETFALLF